MSKNKFIFFILICLLSGLQCKKKINKETLVIGGHWNATRIKIGDSVPKIDYSKMHLVFSPDFRYSFTNNLNKVEAGTFTVIDSLLILMDTTRLPLEEKAMQILKLDKNHLDLKINLSEKEAVMSFRKQ
jgi:hypothetical protein